MYMVIDMKSFFASVECSLRGLNPTTTPLVVVDESRGSGAVVLAVSPYLKTLGIKNRCRLYEIPDDILCIKARPRMRCYIDYAAKLHKIFLRYFNKEDIHLYSIDESFLYISPYLKYYNNSPKELFKRIKFDIESELGVYCTCGCGDNMFLAKVSLDLMAKHNGGYYYLNKDKLASELWDHTPITDFWQIGSGTASHLARLGIYTLGGIAMCDRNILKKEFGIIGDELYMHAWGEEECMISDIKEYKPLNKSISRSQILFKDYTKSEAIIPLLEMAYIISITMCKDNVDAKSLSFYVGYSKDYEGGYIKNISFDFRCRDYFKIAKLIKKYYFSGVKDLPIRRLVVSLNDISEVRSRQLNLFEVENERVISLSRTIGSLWDEYGKNSILLASSLNEASTIRIRNKCIGGHNGE